MAQGIPILKDAPYNVLTVPNYVRSLVVTTKPAQVIAAYTAPPGVEAWTVYRPSAEGVPAHPYDGWRVVTPLSGDAETTVAVTLTEHIVNDTEYVVRVFIRGRLGFQTRKGGAQAMVTPVAGQPASAFPVGTPLAIPMTDGSVQKRIVVHQGNPSPGVYPDSCNGVWTWEAGYGEIRQWSSKLNDYANSSGNAYLNSDYLNKFAPLFRDRIKTVKIPYRPGSGESMTINSGENGLEVRCFYLSGMEVGWPAGADALPICGAKLDYFDAGEGPDSKRAKSEYWWLRDPFCSSSTLYAWAVYRDGSLHNAMDCSTGKLSLPACIIPSDMLFSLTPNPDGSYSPIL